MRPATFAVLASVVALLPAAAPASGGGDGGGTVLRARVDLVRSPSSSDGDVTGWVELRSGDARERFQVEVDHLAAGASVDVLVADGIGTMVPAGSAAADAAGHAELELDTGDGASLPAGAVAAADLVGRAVEVRDADGGLLLSGSAAPLDGSAAASRGRLRSRDDDSGVAVRISMKDQPRLGRQEFRIDVRGLEPESEAELWIDDGTGTLVLAGGMTSSHRGRSRMRQQSRLGHAMPLGVAEIEDLSGRAFEVRSGGSAVLAGVLPPMK